MKKTVVTLLAMAVIAPSLAFAETATVTVTERPYLEDRYGVTQIEGNTVLEGERHGLIGYMDSVKTTVTKTEFKNARSDTEFRANHPNPGSRSTSVEVRETTTFR